MEFEMNRKSNENCYLYSTIYLADEYICDTLEFGSNIALQDGVYSLNLGIDKTKNETVVLVYDFLGNMVSKLVRNNTYLYKEIKMRRETADICVGCKTSLPLLQSDNYAAHLIIVNVSGSLARGIVPKLTIKTPLAIQKTLIRVE